MKSYITLTIVLIAFTALIMLPSAGFAQEEDLPAEEATDNSDKTGTNPINFQRDFRIYNEYSWLNTAGDGNQ